MFQEEYGSPQPMEGLYEVGPPPFLTKTFDMVNDLSIDHIVSWGREGQSIIVWDPQAFSTTVLPRYFKHNNFPSFVRQLNTYGFRKIDADKWEFANELFAQNQRHLLRSIQRRKTAPPIPPPVEVGRFGLESEMESLRRDKQVLYAELVKLRQQQINTRAHLQQMEMRLQGTEMKQQQMMSFLARAMQNPAFLQQLVQLKERTNELEEAIGRKRRRPIESSRVKAEPVELSELEELALEIQGLGKGKREDILEELRNCDKELDDGFWEELLNDGFDELADGLEVEDGEEVDVNVLADRLGFLG